MLSASARAGYNLDGARAGGFDVDRLRAAFGLLTGWVGEGILPAAAALVARGGKVAGEVYVGQGAPGRPATSETVWHLASITKPFTATAVMSLVEAGILDLDIPIQTYVPEFATWARGLWRDQITLRHSLTHCSGLPGFARNNTDLRRAHAPLSAFVSAFGSEPVIFEPGTLHYYSNCGILMAAETVARAVSGKLGKALPEPAIASFHGHVRDRALLPLGMTNTTFFPDADWDDRVARVADVGQPSDWEMSNSAYYRALGIPWGGLYSTPRDLVRFVDSFLPATAGVARMAAGARLLSPLAAATMITQQFAPPDAPAALFPELRDGAPPTSLRPAVPWGVGWLLKGSRRASYFGSLTSPATFGHLGASGTMVWADPATDTALVVLTNRTLAAGWTPEPGRLALFSNAVLGALARRD